MKSYILKSEELGWFKCIRVKTQKSDINKSGKYKSNKI